MILIIRSTTNFKQGVTSFIRFFTSEKYCRDSNVAFCVIGNKNNSVVSYTLSEAAFPLLSLERLNIPLKGITLQCVNCLCYSLLDGSGKVV